MVSQSVQQGRCHAFALKDLPPVAERQVAGQQQTTAFIAIGENLKQQLRTAATERQVPEFIHDQQIRTIQLSQVSISLSTSSIDHDRLNLKTRLSSRVPTLSCWRPSFENLRIIVGVLICQFGATVAPE
jgi:hypothetical protein